MKLYILTICPEYFSSFLSSHVVRRAVELACGEVEVIDLRQFADGSFRHVDDSPFGGGRGLVLRAEPIWRGIQFVKEQAGSDGCHVIGLTPEGKTYHQQKAHALLGYSHIALVCGHYEGMDARVSCYFDEELSIGDYILTGGELPAQVISDSLLRLLPGVLRHGSAEEESFESGMLEYPQYTQPAVWRGQRVPDVLLSGDHGKIRTFRQAEAERVTREKRPDLLDENNV
ncbi:MAG: tRNA (guanosine(37)-N1)-methyltransferase TrmD [Lachnospiraceae bacterium]|jgi:tRNA (guanine37-N1)-methyltransferase|nr:tRNA (guanosine(37)-N1)-methyltransferase TrmD [Lachnospiraceae bacterium]